MNKIASMNLDVVDYIMANEIEKLANIVEGLSDSVKTAHIPSYEEQQTKNERDFALVLWHPRTGKLNKFAMYTPELVELNMAFLSESLDTLPEEVIKVAAANLTRAAGTHKISVPEILSKYASEDYIDNVFDIRDVNEADFVNKMDGQETSPATYAWEKEERYPIDTPINIKKAASYFEKNHYKMPVDKKLEFISNLQKAASLNDIFLTKTAVEKYSSLDSETFNADFYNHVQIRKGYLKDNEDDLNSKYDDLLKEADDKGAIVSALTMYELDKEASLTGTYGKGIEDPLMATLDLPKVASIDVDGVTVTHEQLNGIPDSELTALVGNDVIPELRGEEGLDVLASLPKPIREEITSRL